MTIRQHTTTCTKSLSINQYPEISQQSAVGSQQLSDDPDGNLTNDETFQYAYDVENRLISATPLDTASGLKKVEFGYDYLSRRVQKNVFEWQTDHWSLMTEHWYVYDGWNLIKEQKTGGTPSTDYYVWGLDLSGSLQSADGIGGLLSTTNNLTSKTYLYTFDANGNVGQLVDTSNGTVAAHYEYDPFGNLVVITGSEADKNAFRFSTKYYDVEMGLYYYGYRYYDPVLGRWRTRDPIGEERGANLYVFVGNSPVNRIDPKGLRAYVCFKKHKTFTEVVIAIPIEYIIEVSSEQYASIWLRSSTIASWNAAIERKWTGMFGEYLVTTDVVRRTDIVGTIGADKSPNIVYVLPDHSLLSPNADAEVRNYKIGRWPIQCDGDCAAHEAGHFMGCKDHYHTYPGVAGCFSDPGWRNNSWRNNIMGCSGDPQFGKVEPKNIKEILSGMNIVLKITGKICGKVCGWVGD